METETEMELATENGQKTWQLINEQAAPATPAQLVKNDAVTLRRCSPLFHGAFPSRAFLNSNDKFLYKLCISWEELLNGRKADLPLNICRDKCGPSPSLKAVGSTKQSVGIWTWAWHVRYTALPCPCTECDPLADFFLLNSVTVVRLVLLLYHSFSLSLSLS